MPGWWDWNVSAKARLASTVTAWPLVLFMGAPAMVLLPILVLRVVASVLQTLWNHRLDSRDPLPPRRAGEWAMLATGIVALLLVAALRESRVALPETASVALVMAPFSLAQLATVRRSLDVYGSRVSHLRVLSIRARIHSERGPRLYAADAARTQVSL